MGPDFDSPLSLLERIAPRSCPEEIDPGIAIGGAPRVCSAS